jgi:hypothetical protein
MIWIRALNEYLVQFMHLFLVWSWKFRTHVKLYSNKTIINKIFYSCKKNTNIKFMFKLSGFSIWWYLSNFCVTKQCISKTEASFQQMRKYMSAKFTLDSIQRILLLNVSQGTHYNPVSPEQLYHKPLCECSLIFVQIL